MIWVPPLGSVDAQEARRCVTLAEAIFGNAGWSPQPVQTSSVVPGTARGDGWWEGATARRISPPSTEEPRFGCRELVSGQDPGSVEIRELRQIVDE